MNDVSLNQIYLALLKAERHFPQSTADFSEIKEESTNADAELGRDLELLDEALHAFRHACEAADSKQQAYAMVSVRLHAMNVSTIFSNLAEDKL